MKCILEFCTEAVILRRCKMASFRSFDPLEHCHSFGARTYTGKDGSSRTRCGSPALRQSQRSIHWRTSRQYMINGRVAISKLTIYYERHGLESWSVPATLRSKIKNSLLVEGRDRSLSNNCWPVADIISLVWFCVILSVVLLVNLGEHFLVALWDLASFYSNCSSWALSLSLIQIWHAPESAMIVKEQVSAKRTIRRICVFCSCLI